MRVDGERRSWEGRAPLPIGIIRLRTQGRSRSDVSKMVPEENGFKSSLCRKKAWKVRNMCNIKRLELKRSLTCISLELASQ